MIVTPLSCRTTIASFIGLFFNLLDLEKFRYTHQKAYKDRLVVESFVILRFNEAIEQRMTVEKVMLFYALLAVYIFISHVASGQPTTSDRSFTIDYEDNCFLKDGKPFRYISGEIHYFRIPSIYWRDRLLKAKALGVNTIQTYIPWNLHEVAPLQYDFSGNKDFLQFIDIAHELGLLVILRPGPYICAEWDFGGFPWWLAKNKTLQMRTSDPVFMQKVQVWFYAILPMLKTRLYKYGGPVIAFQVENEYGSYPVCSKEYLSLLKKLYHFHYGDDVSVLFTVDNYSDDTMQCGTTPELFGTVDFGTNVDPNTAFKQQRKYQKNGPLVNTEFYTGWLDHWGEPRQQRDPAVVAEQLDKILALNASVNMYMIHGGTNFGFMNGVQGFPDRKINPTSYDYDAPISEAGDTTEKFFKIRDVLRKYVNVPTDPVPKNTTKSSYGPFPANAFYNFTQFIDVVYPLKNPLTSIVPLTMEEMDLAYGFANYRTQIPEEYQNKTTQLTIEFVSDRTMILMDGELVNIVEEPGSVELNITLGKQIDIFIENQGRVSYATKGVHFLPLQKGIVGGVFITEKKVPLLHWSNYALNDSKFSGKTEEGKNSLAVTQFLERSGNYIKNNGNDTYMCTIYGFLYLDILLDDTFLYLHGFKKGQAYVNEFNLGRFWQNKGPQLTLFVPKSAFKLGLNTVTVLSLDKIDSAMAYMEFVKEPKWT